MDARAPAGGEELMGEPRLRIISLGAGVQSTTMALLAAHGIIGPMPDCAIFADTGWEPKAVYEHLKWLMSGVLPFPVHVVSAGNIRDHIVRGENTTGQRFATVPWFTGDGGMGRRQCTREFKIDPLARKQRELLGCRPRQRIPAGSVEVWIGISTDEAIRMKPSRDAWQVNRWPLIEQGMSRRDCTSWLLGMDYPLPPKSSCIGCPYHSDAQWREIRERPEEWADAVAIDRLIRQDGTTMRGMRAHQYMHRSLKPLDEVDLRTHEERGQPDLFNNECEGLCGV